MTESSTRDVLKSAMGAHGIFKARLLEAIELGNLAEFAAARSARNDLCTFGKWLHDEILPTLKQDPHYLTVL